MKISASTLRTCSGCLKELPTSEFYVKESRKGNLRSRCKICYVDRHREPKLIAKYGITLAEFNQLVLDQNGLCKICFNPQILRPQERTARVLCVDHDHKTGKVRGLLCDTCNRFLGLAKDDIGILKSALNYLETSEDIS